MPQVDVYFLPQLVEPESLAGGVSVVIDVLRATTTITAALAAGARDVVPCLEVDEARAAAANLPAGQAVLGGERDGLRIAGFALGNSPREYTPDAVGGKTLVFTTTNGTRAMWHAQSADEVWLAAFVNLSTVAQACEGRKRVDLICSGTAGKITREDVLLAGAIVAHLTARAAAALNDQAAIARAAWLQVAGNPAAVGPPADPEQVSAAVALALRETQGGAT